MAAHPAAFLGEARATELDRNRGRGAASDAEKGSEIRTADRSALVQGEQGPRARAGHAVPSAWTSIRAAA